MTQISSWEPPNDFKGSQQLTFQKISLLGRKPDPGCQLSRFSGRFGRFLQNSEISRIDP